MTNVFIVTQGEHDSAIIAAFSTREKAEQFVGRQPEDAAESARCLIVECPVDTLPPLVWSQRWWAELYPGGSVETTESVTDRQLGDNGYAGGNDYVYAYSYISAEHAMRLATEHDATRAAE